MTVQGITLLREMITLLERLGDTEAFQDNDIFGLSSSGNAAVGGVAGDIKKLIAHVKQLEQLMTVSQESHADKLVELMRHHTHYLNVWSVRAPPDQGPELQTVPWMVGRHSTTVAPKGELAKRTADAPPTVQKPQPKTRGRGKGAKRAKKDGG